MLSFSEIYGQNVLIVKWTKKSSPAVERVLYAELVFRQDFVKKYNFAFEFPVVIFVL